MKKTLMIFAAIVMMAGFSTTVMAQTSAKISDTHAGAVLIVPMTIAQDAPLHFGSITLLSTAAASTVTLPSNSITRAFSAGVSAAGVTSDPATNAAYHVTGTYNETYALALPSSVILTEKGGVATMTADAFKARFNGAVADAVVSTLSATGTDDFTLGATLNLAIGQIGGIYAGTFDVTVDYN